MSEADRPAAGRPPRSPGSALRTRAAITDAAGRCVERYGVRKTTMGDVAAEAGVAKATLYNHFRTKDDVLGALVDTRVAALGERCAAVAAGRAQDVPGLPPSGSGLAAAVALAAEELGRLRPLRRVAADEPAALAALVVPGESTRWQEVRAVVGRVLAVGGAADDPPAVDLALRLLLGHVLLPADGPAARGAGEVLAAGLGAPAGPVDGAAGPSAASEPEPGARPRSVAEAAPRPEPDPAPDPGSAPSTAPDVDAPDPSAAPAGAAVPVGLGWPG